MAVSLHLYFGLKAAFEFKSKVAVVNGDTLDQLSDQPFVVVRHRLLLALQVLPVPSNELWNKAYLP